MKTSKEFMDAVCDSATHRMGCDFCGRTHFATGDLSSLSDLDRMSLEALAKSDPDRYIASHDDAISSGELDGKTFVWNCPCDQLAKYEAFIWNNRGTIAKYLANMHARAKAEASELGGMVNQVQG